MKPNQQTLLNDGFFEDISLCLCAKTQSAPGQFLSPATRSHYTFHYVLSGKGEISMKPESYALKAWEGILIPPNTYASYQADKDEPWQYLWIGFLGKRAGEVLSAIGLDSLTQPFSCPFPKELLELADKMLAFPKGTVDQIFLRQSLLVSLLSLLTRNQPSGKIHVKKAGIHPYVADAMDFISRRYSQPLPVYEIAAHLKITRNYLYTLFKKELQCSPQEYLTDFRLGRACGLLTQTEYSIDAIARSCGYPEPALFSKAFKKKYGQTPSQFREKSMA